MNPLFWKDKKVLITGHTGFKGSWLSLWLQNMNADVIGVSLDPPTVPSIFKQARISEGIVSLREDIRNLGKMNEIFQKYQPEIVFHLAAQPLVRYSYREPVETYQTNVMGTLNILEGIRGVDSVRSAVMITTDKCYENHEWEWGYREIDPLGGHDPYSSSKGCAELLIASYRNSYFNPDSINQHGTAIASARAGNVIGGGDWAEDRLIPDIIRALQQGKKVKIRNPDAIRPWQHVLEPLYGYLVLAEKLHGSDPQYTGAWNFGPYENDVGTVKTIVKNITSQWSEESTWSIDNDKHPHEANYLKLDCSKAHSRLKWKPKWNLTFALKKIVEWYKAEDAGRDLRKLTLDQINEYMNEK